MEFLFSALCVSIILITELFEEQRDKPGNK